jgi:hypothetical protein
MKRIVAKEENKIKIFLKIIINSFINYSQLTESTAWLLKIVYKTIHSMYEACWDIYTVMLN